MHFSQLIVTHTYAQIITNRHNVISNFSQANRHKPLVDAFKPLSSSVNNLVSWYADKSTDISLTNPTFSNISCT